MKSTDLYLFITIVIFAVGFIPFKVLIHIFRNSKKDKNE